MTPYLSPNIERRMRSGELSKVVGCGKGQMVENVLKQMPVQDMGRAEHIGRMR